jgi:hypothetical protein
MVPLDSFCSASKPSSFGRDRHRDDLADPSRARGQQHHAIGATLIRQQLHTARAGRDARRDRDRHAARIVHALLHENLSQRNGRRGSRHRCRGRRRTRQRVDELEGVRRVVVRDRIDRAGDRDRIRARQLVDDAFVRQPGRRIPAGAAVTSLARAIFGELSGRSDVSCGSQTIRA